MRFRIEIQQVVPIGILNVKNDRNTSRSFGNDIATRIIFLITAHCQQQN